MDFYEALNEALKSPLLVAIVTVLGVKIVDYFGERSKTENSNKQAEKGTLWGRIEKLEAEVIRVNEKNDVLIQKNASTEAHLSFLEEQNKLQASQIAKLETQKDQATARYEADHEALMKAQIRIAELVNYVRILETRLRKYEQVQTSELPTTE